MTEQTITFLSGYGLPGVIIFALFYSLYHMVKLLYHMIQLNKDERDKWLNTLLESNKLSDERHRDIGKVLDTRQKETNDVLRELTTIIERHTK